MIPNENMSKDSYNVNVFDLKTGLIYLTKYSCVYYTTRTNKKAVSVVGNIKGMMHGIEGPIENYVNVRRLGRRVLLERTRHWDVNKVQDIVRQYWNNYLDPNMTREWLKREEYGAEERSFRFNDLGYPDNHLIDVHIADIGEDFLPEDDFEAVFPDDPDEEELIYEPNV